MKIYIKNMVCNRCIMVVKQALEHLDLTPLHVALGEVHLAQELNDKQKKSVKEQLEALGFELLGNQKQKQIEKIKSLLIKKAQAADASEHFLISDYLSQHLLKDYSYLSRLFSEVEGTTIEQFFILQKIEKVKELLVYNELTLSEMAWKLGYSSVAHLSTQFKKITGLSPTEFKKLGNKNRRSLDEV